MEFAVIEGEQALDPRLRSDLIETWVAASDAGGSIGFTPPTPVDDVTKALDHGLGRVAEGEDAMGVLLANDRAVGMGMLVDRGAVLQKHWRTVLRVMVHPEFQGGGAGLRLMRGLHELGGRLGLEHLQLTVRGGEGLETFYAKVGYEVTGRHPGAIRVAPGDDRDEVMMAARLSPSSGS